MSSPVLLEVLLIFISPQLMVHFEIQSMSKIGTSFVFGQMALVPFLHTHLKPKVWNWNSFASLGHFGI